MRCVTIMGLGFLPLSVSAVDEVIHLDTITIPRTRAQAPAAPDQNTIDLRRQAMLLQASYDPELACTVMHRGDDSENLTRARLALRGPLDERWQWAMVATESHYDMQASDPASAALHHAEGRLHWRLDERWQGVGSVQAWTGREAEGLGIAIDLIYADDRGITAWLHTGYHEVWDDSGFAVHEDGHRHRAYGSLGLPLAERWRCDMDAEVGDYHLGARSNRPDRAGTRWELSARLSYAIFDRDRGIGVMEGRMRDDREFFPDDLEFGWWIWTQIARSSFDRETGFAAVPVIDDAAPWTVGSSYRQPVSSRLGIELEAAVGQDAQRDIAFGDLGTIDARLVYDPGWNGRLWFAGGLSSESPTNADSGTTHRIGLGLNWHF